MKIKNKGKVFPSPSYSSSSSSSSSSVSSFSSPERDFLSVLNLLPAAIIALASVLSLEDREVLAYLITKSMKTTTDSFSFIDDSKKRSSKRSYISTSAAVADHKPPLFDCDCFDCYTSYWFRWDSSSNRELIHQAIEAFEDHLANGEQSKKNNRGKRRDKIGRRTMEKPMDISGQLDASVSETTSPEIEELQENDVTPLSSPEERAAVRVVEMSEVVKAEVRQEWAALVVGNTAANNHKGLARKVLPDVMGIFNSRLWNLWSPNS